MKHILLVTDSYPPEIRSASHLMLELAEELRDRQYQVTVVTCSPQYNLDPNQSKEFSEDMNENGVRVIRIKHMAHHKVSFLMRGIAQLLLPYLFIRKIKKYLTEKVDAVIVYSPPLPLSFVGMWAKRKWKAKFILNVQDLFPQNAIDLGVIKNPKVALFFKWMEKLSYQKADVVTTHSAGNQALLLRYYPFMKSKCVVLHNWVDIAAHNNQSPKKNFRDLFQLNNKFVAVFAGVIGPSQHLEILIDAATQLNHLSDLYILIVGDGTEKKKLEHKVSQYHLNNVIFKPFVGRDDYADLLHACDIGLVSLSAKNRTPVVPGKILGYMAASLPVVAFLNKESDGHFIIQDAQCGYSVVSDKIENIIAVLQKAYESRDQSKTLGQAGFDYVTTHFSKEMCVDQIENLFR